MAASAPSEKSIPTTILLIGSFFMTSGAASGVPAM
jgi:hypothetical protein